MQTVETNSKLFSSSPRDYSQLGPWIKNDFFDD